jgi:hypothetical protein
MSRGQVGLRKNFEVTALHHSIMSSPDPIRLLCSLFHHGSKLFKRMHAIVPIGCGQREVIIGDCQTGKTAVAVNYHPRPEVLERG